jgi:hypothetical protein
MSTGKPTLSTGKPKSLLFVGSAMTRPLPGSAYWTLEDSYVPSVERVVEAVRKLL